MIDFENQRAYFKSFLLKSSTAADQKSMDVFIDEFERFSFRKKELIVRPGDISNVLFFVIEGVQRSYYFREKEHTIAFAYEDSFCAVPDSFLLNRPSKHYLEAVTDSLMLGIRREKFYRLMEQYEWLLDLMLGFQQMVVAGLHDRMTEIMALSMEERFEVFCHRSFHLFSRIPHKHIASYLNMDPTNLSKLLNKKLV